jgi:hypothetical protein
MNDTMGVMGEAMAQGLDLGLGLGFFSSGARFRLGILPIFIKDYMFGKKIQIKSNKYKIK